MLVGMCFHRAACCCHGVLGAFTELPWAAWQVVGVGVCLGRSVMVGLGSCGWWAPMLVALAGGGGGRWGAVVCWWCAWLLARGLAQTRRVTAALLCLNRLFLEKAMLKKPSHYDTTSIASGSSWGVWKGPPRRHEEEKEKSGDDSSEISMDTKSSSKHSKSRAEKDRGPKRTASKLARTKEHYAKLGKPWVDGPKKHRQLGTELATGRKGSVASAMHTEAIEEKREKEAQPTPIEDALIKEIPPDMTKWIHMVNGEPRCRICQKWATEGHLKSSEHVKRIEEDALGTLMGGEAKTTRRFNGDRCTGVLTKKLMFEFWGDALANLPKAASEVHAREGVFYNEKKPIKPSDVVYELGVVSYPGQGKYHECNKYIAFHELPDQEETASEEERNMRSPEGQGWWPVIALQKVAETTKEGATTTKVLVV